AIARAKAKKAAKAAAQTQQLDEPSTAVQTSDAEPENSQVSPPADDKKAAKEAEQSAPSEHSAPEQINEPQTSSGSDSEETSSEQTAAEKKKAAVAAAIARAKAKKLQKEGNDQS
ncbi:electron transport complex subunit RsxC, partial [Pseudoalteromonas sp. S3785]